MQHFKALLQQLSDIYLKHTRTGLFRNCARTYKALLTREHALKNISDPSFTALTDELTEKLLELLPKFHESVCNACTQFNVNAHCVITQHTRSMAAGRGN